MPNLFDIGTQGYNIYQLGENFEDAQHDIKQGFDQARADITEQQQPFVNFGLEHLQPYNDLGEFGFDFNNDYLNSKNYEWLRDQGQQGVERSAAASPQGYLSGKTLTDLSTWNQDYAQSQYQNEWERQQKTYDTNRAYHEFPIKTGVAAAENLGNNLADIGIGRGASLASLHGSQAMALSRALSSTAAAISPSTGLSGDLSAVGGIAGTVMDAAGNILDQAGNFISNLWDGGGLDGNGDWGLLGDLGGFITGNFGDGYRPDLRNLDPTFFDPGFWGEGTGLGDPLQDFWSDASPWDDPDLSFINDNSWWDDMWTGIRDVTGDAWDNVTNWASDFFG